MAGKDWEAELKRAVQSSSQTPVFRGSAMRMMSPAQKSYLKSLLSPEEYDRIVRADLTAGQAGALISRTLREAARRGTMRMYDDYDGPVEVTVGSGRRVA